MLTDHDRVSFWACESGVLVDRVLDLDGAPKIRYHGPGGQPRLSVYGGLAHSHAYRSVVIKIEQEEVLLA
jgi:hypothetical protein